MVWVGVVVLMFTYCLMNFSHLLSLMLHFFLCICFCLDCVSIVSFEQKCVCVCVFVCQCVLHFLCASMLHVYTWTCLIRILCVCYTMLQYFWGPSILDWEVNNIKRNCGVAYHFWPLVLTLGLQIKIPQLVSLKHAMIDNLVSSSSLPCC